MPKEVVVKEKLIVLDGKKYNKQAFMIEEYHPAVGKILIFDDIKFKVMDRHTGFGGHKSGTFIKKLTEEDEEVMREYDENLEELSAKLVDKVDIKRLIKENIKNKPLQEIKTGLFILKAEEKGEKIVEEHHQGCYNYKMHHKSQIFDFMSGHDVGEDLGEL